MASLILGVAAAGASRAALVTAGVAGLVSGALSMAAGEYVSVSSQRDVELADLDLEARELAADPQGELEELAGIYERRGLDPELARRVATELSAGDRLEAHARDELGLDRAALARPWQAAGASAASFTAGAVVPLVAIAAPGTVRIPLVVGLTLAGARDPRVRGRPAGRRPHAPATLRVAVWGAAAMALTAGIGALVGTVV